MKPKKLSVDAGKKDRERGATYARGGNDRMFPEQAANPQKPAVTGHAVKGGAPGAKAARGGPPVRVGGLSVPAQGGRTGPG
jgi:hypothetical protein